MGRKEKNVAKNKSILKKTKKKASGLSQIKSLKIIEKERESCRVNNLQRGRELAVVSVCLVKDLSIQLNMIMAFIEQKSEVPVERIVKA